MANNKYYNLYVNGANYVVTASLGQGQASIKIKQYENVTTATKALVKQGVSIDTVEYDDMALELLVLSLKKQGWI